MKINVAKNITYLEIEEEIYYYSNFAIYSFEKGKRIGEMAIC